MENVLELPTAGNVMTIMVESAQSGCAVEEALSEESEECGVEQEVATSESQSVANQHLTENEGSNDNQGMRRGNTNFFFKVLGTFQTCSHRTTLISFALGACSGPAASNAWQEMSQYDGGLSLAFLVGFIPISE